MLFAEQEDREYCALPPLMHYEDESIASPSTPVAQEQSVAAPKR